MNVHHSWQANSPWSVGQCATLACLLEVSAPKPGNVHRGADFEDVTFEDFVISAVAIGPILDRAVSMPLGRVVWQAIQATRERVGSNTNLGIVLLLAPLAAVPSGHPLPAGVAAVLSTLSRGDCGDVYAAIRHAQPGGLARVEQADVADPPPDDLLAAMRLAADRDLIARQYVTNFQTVFDQVVPWLLEGRAAGWPLRESIVRAYLRLLSVEPDSLIARKCGWELAKEVSCRAASVLDAGLPGDSNYYAALADLDFWLRSDGHRRNPGTTADLIAAALFALLRDRLL